MDELKKLYDVLYREGKYTKSFEEFQTKWGQDQAYKEKVFEVVSRDGLYTKDKDSFFQKYSGAAVAPSAVAQQIPVAEEVKKKEDTTALPSAVGSLDLSEQPEEQDYFTGAFGSVLRGLDNIVPIGIGDFVDDMARSVAAGYRQGTAAQEADKLLLQGTKATPEQIQKFIIANKNAQALGSSAEMQDYQRIYEDSGKGFWGVVKGLANNPSIIPEVLTSSITAMATNTDALTAGAAAVGTGAGIGAGAGALAGGVGAIPGAAAGAISSVPYAFGLASSVVEMGATFGELLQEELGGQEMTKDNVKAILESPEKLNSIRNRAIARGLIIGTVDAFTGKLASGVGAKIISKSAAKSATGAATKAAATKATGVGAVIEGAGGSLGEATARGAIGQEMDVSEIALEGIAELPGGIRSTIQARLAKPSYKVNGGKVSAEQVDELINTMSPDELAQTKIDIKNDYEGRQFKIQDKIVTSAIKEQVRQGNPDLNEPSLNAITELEKELKKLEGNTTQTGKDKAAAIRGQIKNIQENQLQEEAVTETITAEQDAIQEQATGQVPVQPTTGVSQKVQEGLTQAEPQVTAEAGAQEEVVSSKTRVNIAPFFDTRVETVQEAEQLRQAPEYKAYKETLVQLAEQLGIPGIAVDDVIGGYKNEAGEEIVEISNQITFENATLDQVEEYAAMIAALAPEVQEASIAAQYVNEGDETHNANEYRFKVNNIDNAIKALKGAGITDFSINENESTVTFTDVFDFADAQLQDKIGKFAELLDENNTSYEQQQFRPTESRYLDKGKRKEIIRRVKGDGARLESRGQGFSEAIEQAIQRDAAFQGTTYEEYTGAKPKGPAAGNRLFNEPIKAVAEIANRYYQRAFGTQRPDFKGTRQLDKARAKKISDAFDAMKHSPNDPQVRAAYNALAKETIAQYQAFLDAGYVVEINNQEPYANSQEMIDDLRNNKRIKIFSTESGFGDTPITAKQRKENPLLAKTKFTDVNGQPMLVNDLFRAVHDFFGHAELGNSFGPLGEENAWNVHARMYSPLARRAMTTETRGQNSYVNFSGVNEEADRIREQARKLREEGKLEEALRLTDEIYEKTSFADQKVGLLPEEFSQIDEEVAEQPVAEVEVVEAAPAELTPITASDVKTPIFTKENAVDFEEDLREDTKGREYKYLSSVTVQTTDADGNAIGSITKTSDGEGGPLIFTVQDSNGRKVNKGKEYPTLRDAKVALAEEVNKKRQKEQEKTKAKAEKAKAREKAKQKAKEPQVEEEVVEEVQGKMDELLELDPKAKGTGQKILDGLDGMIKDIEKFEKGTLGVNIALPIMKGILKTIRGLVQAGMVLADAIKQVAKDNGTTVKQIVNGINAIGQIAPIQEAYDALMTKADALIARQKSRGIAEKKIVSNLDTMIRNSEVYKNATDAQRKIMEREARVKMGVGPRKAASIGRVIGVLKDITNVSRQEKLQIIARIRELSRDVAKDLSAEIKSLAKEGKITAIQAANIIARFGNVNLLNEVSVSNFVDYMAKVFADAEYDSKIAKANSRVAKARKNIATKIGIADGLMLPLQKLFAINPNLIPDNSLERYLELLDMFSASEAVLTLEDKNTVKKDVDAILDEINNEQSRADELAEVFSNSDNQVFDDGDLDYAASLKKMVKEGDITEEDATLMRKYKQDIIPQVEPTKLSDEEIAKKKKEYITALQKQKVNAEGLPSTDERKLAKRLSALIDSLSEQSLMKLSLTDLKNLLKVTDNINNGYLPHYAQVMVEKLNAIKYGKILAAAIKKAKPLSFTALYSKFKAAIIRSQKGGIAEMVRRNPLFYIDQVFGDFKTKDIFNSLFEMAAEGEANFKAELKKVQNILESAEAKIAKSFKLDPDKTLMSKFKMMTYMIQLEYESNKGSEQVNPAAAYLKETIKHIDDGKSRFGERDANMLQDILDEYAPNGEIDIDKLYNSFNQAEKDAIADIRGINESLKDKAQYTAAIIRGDAIDPLNNYVHLNVLHDTEPLDVSAATDFLNQANNSRRPSTRAKSLIARTKGAKPLNFDVFASAQRGAKFVLMDYNLTEPIRTARRTLNQATAELEAEGRLPKQQRDIKNAIEGAFEEAVSNLLTNSILQNSLADEAIDFISKQGYRSVLAGTGRFAAELTSNIAFAVLADPRAFSAGTKYRDIIMSTDAPRVLENVNSKQTNRIFPSDTLSGKFVDTSILSQASGIQGRSSKNPVFNKMQQIYNLTLKKPQNVVELTADTLISTPDKLVMRPLWFGSFANEFKKISGKDVDFKKIAANDQAYMDANKDAIEQSKKTADEKSVMAGATDNAFMGILKGTVKPNQSFSSRAFNNFNNYMTRFLIFEYVTARTAIYAMVGNGSLSKRQGAAMLGAVATRMTVYTLLSQMLANGIMGLFGMGDDEEEDEKSLMQKIGQSLTSTFTSLLLGRDFGNATKLAINYGVEEVNERFLDFLREGEYDPYKDGIAFSLIPRDDRRDDDLSKLLVNMGGSFTPALNTASLIYKNRSRIITGETEKKELAAIEREDRTVKERIPLEVLGHLGFIPLYKDVRKLVNNSIYSSIKEGERAAARTKQIETDLLGGYENKTDLKRYNPELYEKNFGKGSEWYESTKEEREAKEKEAKEEQAIKDRMNNYTPKDDGFGSSGFGEGTKKKSKKSGGGFGSKKFGD